MPRFAANISMMFNEVPFLDRFERAAKAGFKAVEFLFPYEFPAAEIATRLADNGLQQVLFNGPPGDWTKGERGIAALPGRQQEFREGIKQALEYSVALRCPLLHVMAGLKPEGMPYDGMLAAYAANLAWAGEQGIPAVCVDHKAFADRPAFEAALDAQLRALEVEIVCLAGFLRVLTPGFVGRWDGRLVNIHPSLLPAFPGLDTHERALAAGVRLHGCTVHLVSAGVDEGPILAQAAVPVLADDTPATLAARVLAEEHRSFPAALGWVAAGRVTVAEGRAVVAGVGAPAMSLLNPLPEPPPLPKPAPAIG